MKCTLTVDSNPDDIKSFEFNRDETTIGRIMGNDLVINDMSVSRYHARIVRTEGSFELIDLDSKNGIKHNGERVKSALLHDGDRIEIGKVPLKFCCSALSTKPAPKQTTASPVPELKAKKIEKIIRDAAERLKTMFNNDKSEEKPAEIRGADAEGFRTDMLSHPFVLIVLAVLLVIVVVLSMTGKDRNVPDYSDIPVPLPDRGYYGNMKENPAYADRVIFTFSREKGRTYLSYNIGWSDAGEVDILLNGHKLGSAPSSEGWMRVHDIQLPPEYLKSGENRLVFDNVMNPTGSRAGMDNVETWGVSEVNVLLKDQQ